jgi:hypothetical protein
MPDESTMGLRSDEKTSDFKPRDSVEPTLGVTVDAATKSVPDTQARASGRSEPDFPGYELLGELGRGGMGVVYRARQVRANRVVALKMILSADLAGENERERFRREAEAIASLDHPNVVKVFDVGEHLGHDYFALEYCPGETLSAKLGSTPLPSRHRRAAFSPDGRVYATAGVGSTVEVRNAETGRTGFSGTRSRARMCRSRFLVRQQAAAYIFL